MFDNLEWKIIARDLASDVTKKVADSQRALAEETRKAAETAKRAQQSWVEQAKGVLSGTAAYDLFKSAVGTVADFLRGSVEASMNAAAAMAQVKQNVENAGVIYDTVKNKIEEYSKRMVQMGFDDEDTATSVSRLMLVTNDYGKALLLNRLAMDLARSKNLDLASATALVTQVTQGQNKVLKQYGIELSDTASAADNLNALQIKVKGSTEAFADTTKAKMTIVRTQWENLKEQIGDKLTPVLGNVLTMIEKGMPHAAEAVEKVAKAFEKVGSATSNAAALLSGLDKKMGEMLGKNQGFFSSIISEKISDFKNGGLSSIKTNIETIDNSIKAYEVAKNAFNIFDASLSKNAAGARKNAAVQATSVYAVTAGQIEDLKNKTNNGGLNPFSGIGSQSGAVGEARQKISTELKKLGDDYKKAVGDAAESLSKLENAHTKATAEITQKISDLKKSLKELQDQYSAQTSDNNKSEAERVIEQEKKVADLKKQLAEASSRGENTSDIQSELNKEQAALQNYYATRKGLEAEIAEARRRASETEFERFLEDLTKKRAEAQADFQQKSDQIKSEIAEQEAAKAAEELIYEAKRKQYLKTQEQFTLFHDSYVGKLTNMKKVTQETVDQMTKKLEEINALGARVDSARNRAGITAGIISQAEAASGEAAAQSKSSTQTININLGGVTVTTKQDADNLVQNIIRQLQLQGFASS